MVMAEGGLRHSAEQREGAAAHAARFLGRILLPAAGFLAVGALAYDAHQAPAHLFGALEAMGLRFNPGSWFTVGQFWVLGLFFVANLTSRRYGAGVALGGFVLALLLAGGVWTYATFGTSLPMPLPLGEMPTVSASAALMGGLVLGILIDIALFDLFRGIPWWRAPLYAPLAGGAAFVGVYHAAMGAALPGEWTERALMHFAVWAVGTLLMLAVYHMLRPLVRPLPGFGGA